MDSSVENERWNTDHRKRSSDDEIAFRDWHFVDRSEDQVEQGSDDDSIEVIECEVSNPLPSMSDSDSEESIMEEYFKDFSNDANVPEEWIDMSEPEFTEPIRTIVPLKKKYRCRSRSSYVQKSNRKRNISYAITSKVLYSFVLGVLASLVFQKYKSSIPNGTYTFSLGHSFMIKDLFNSWFPDESLDYPWTNGLSRGCVQLSFERRKNINDVRMQQLNLSMYARHVVGDVYSFNIAELAPQLIREEDIVNHLNLKKPIPACKDNITDEHLPLICENDHVFFVYTEGIHLISAHRAILQFFYEIDKRTNSLRDNILISLTESNRLQKSTSDRDSSYFVRECDHLSEHFERTKRNSYSEGFQPSIHEERRDDEGWSDPRSGRDEGSKLSTNDDRKNSGGLQFSKAASKSETKSIRPDDKRVDTKMDCGLCSTLVTVIKNELTKVVEEEVGKSSSRGQLELEKFLKSCRPCQTVGYSLESASPTEDTIVDDDEEMSVDVDEELEDEPSKFDGREKKEPISGEWLFNLYEARAKLRSYYDKIVSGDWLLKLGRARDRLRNAKSEDYRQNGDSEKFEKVKKEYQGQYWYKKNMDKLKHKFKTIMRQLKDTKESIANKFKELKSKFKNKFCK